MGWQYIGDLLSNNSVSKYILVNFNLKVQIILIISDLSKTTLKIIPQKVAFVCGVAKPMRCERCDDVVVAVDTIEMQWSTLVNTGVVYLQYTGLSETLTQNFTRKPHVTSSTAALFPQKHISNTIKLIYFGMYVLVIVPPRNYKDE